MTFNEIVLLMTALGVWSIVAILAYGLFFVEPDDEGEM
jgi:hypothetical protein